MKNSYTLLFVLLSIVACVSKKSVKPPPAAEKAEVKKEIESNLIEIREPILVYNQKCGTCHKPYNPGDFTEADWKVIVPDMVNKANQHELTIGPGQKEMILQYLIANAKK